MINIKKYSSLGGADYGWLKARHHFSFGNYYDPKRLNFGKLRVVNDDIVQPGTGFDTHPHRHMEIITYVRQGAITHEDSQGNKGRTAAGDVQVMSAGLGIFHSEHNFEDSETILYQIWIEPNTTALKPSWDQQQFPKEPVQGELNVLASGSKPGGLRINQDATIYGGRLAANTTIHQPIEHQAYLLVSAGSVEVEGQSLDRGDGAEISASAKVTIKASSDAEVLLIDVPS